MDLRYLVSYYLEHGDVDVLRGSCLYGLFLYMRKELSMYDYDGLRGFGGALQVLSDWDVTVFDHVCNIVNGDDFSLQVIVGNIAMCYVDVHGEGRLVDDYLHGEKFKLGMCKIKTKEDGEYIRMIRDCVNGVRRFIYLPVEDEVVARCCFSLETIHCDKLRLND